MDGIRFEGVPEESALVETLVDWAETPSGSDEAGGLARMAEKLRAAFADLPGEGELVELPPAADLGGAPVPVGAAYRHRCRPEAPVRVLLSGHMDTVYGPDHPFKRCTFPERGVLRGPGVADMKGGLVIMRHAINLLESSPHAGNLGWEVLINADEEIGSPGSRGLLRESAQRNTVGLVFESALPDGSLVRRRKGSGVFRAAARGRAAHTGRDFEDGRNAIIALSGLLVRLHSLNDTVPGAIVNVGRARGGRAVNVVPDFAEAFVNIRISKAEDLPDLNAQIENLLKVANKEEGIHIEWHGEMARPPKSETPATEQLHEWYADIAREHGIDCSQRDTGGASDGNILAAEGLPHLDGVGARGGRIHSEEEFILTASLPERIALAGAFLRRLADPATEFPRDLFRMTQS
ncbi:MAG: hydrolase [Opitutales bacterium]|nr:hydrolase [Opitutales bacterium]